MMPYIGIFVFGITVILIMMCIGMCVAFCKEVNPLSVPPYEPARTTTLDTKYTGEGSKSS